MNFKTARISLKNFKKYRILLNSSRVTSFEKFRLWQYFLNWSRSLELERSPLKYEFPWVTFRAIDFMEKYLNKKMRVFEYGSGGSTLFFSKRAAEVVSIEHNLKWYEQVKAQLAERRNQNVLLKFIEAVQTNKSLESDAGNPDHYNSTCPEYKNHSFQEYAQAIDIYPDNYFDLVLIDGRARPSCVKHAKSKVKKEGLIVLDNSERPHYQFAQNQLRENGWKEKVFRGPGPYNSYCWQTTVWRYA